MSIKRILLVGFAACSFAQQHDAAGRISEECISSIEHPPATVTQNDGVYTQCYTVTYTQICPNGLCPEIYTVTETCREPVCRYPMETAPPPGFTTGAISCDTCHSGGPITTTLTFPLASMGGYDITAPTLSPPASPTGSAPRPVQAGASVKKLTLAIGAVPLSMMIANLVL